jgi:precorrin-3B methylase
VGDGAAAVASLFIAALALAVTAAAFRRSSAATKDAQVAAAQGEYVRTLERQVDEMKGNQVLMQRELDECRRAREDFREQNFVLLSRLYALEHHIKERKDE